MGECEDPARSVDEIVVWLTAKVADALKLPVATIDIHRSLVDHGLDSAGSLELLGDLEDFLGGNLPDTLLYDFRTIAAIAEEVSHRVRRTAAR